MKIAGKELKIEIASFEEVLELQDAISEAAGEKKISLDIGDPKDLTKKSAGNLDIGELATLVLSLVKSKRVRAALFNCSKRCHADSAPIDLEFFEKPENRKHYYPIMIEVIKVNIAPLLESLISKFPGIDLKKMSSILK